MGQVIAVGVGDADMAELRQIASPPYDTTVYHVSNYDSIDDIQSLLSVKLCESESKSILADHCSSKSLFIFSP